MRLLIVDDEPAARSRLRRLLAAHADVSEVVEAADAPEALQRAAAGLPFDLALLDIEMPGGNGLQLAEALRARGLARHCVFSTAYAEHALRAFEIGAQDYLLKPFDAARLATTLGRVRALLALPAPAASLHAPAGERWVQAADGRRLRIQLSEVQWVGAADNYVALHLPAAEFLERGTLSDWLQQPEVAGLFVRVHRSHAVNPAQVLAFAPLSNSGEALLTLRCGVQLRVSRRYRHALQPS